MQLTRLDIDGNIIEVIDLPDELAEQSAIDLLQAMEPAMATAVIAAAAGFVERAGDLWGAFVVIPVDEPAHDAIEVVTDIALSAALPLVGE